MTVVKLARSAIGVTQHEMAKEIGISRPTYMGLESNKATPKRCEAIAIWAAIYVTYQAHVDNEFVQLVMDTLDFPKSLQVMLEVWPADGGSEE